MVFAAFSGEMRGVWPCAGSRAIASEESGRLELCLRICVYFGHSYILYAFRILLERHVLSLLFVTRRILYLCDLGN